MEKGVTGCAARCFTAPADDVGTGYYVNLPVVGRLESRHRRSKIIASRELPEVAPAVREAVAAERPG